MRLAYTSDLHADVSERNAALLPHLAARLRADPSDLFVIAGDVAESAAAVESALRAFDDVPGERIYVAGNHDLFAEGVPGTPTEIDSRRKFESVLPEVAARAGFHYGGLEALHFGDVAVVAVPGWFDFTLRDPSLASVIDVHAYRAGQWRGHRAYDRGHVLWPRDPGGAAAGERPPRRVAAGEQPASVARGWASDEEIAESMLERLDAQLAAAHGARQIVAVVHVLPFAQLVRRGAFGPNGFFDAYLGSARLGERLLREPRVRVLVSGHLHRSEERRIGAIETVARALGDARRQPGFLEELAERWLGRIDLSGSSGDPI